MPGCAQSVPKRMGKCCRYGPLPPGQECFRGRLSARQKHFCDAPTAERCQTPYRLLEGQLWEQDDKLWKFATKLPDYAPRKRRPGPPGARQDPLFPPEEAVSS